MNFKQATCAVILALGSVFGVALSGAQQPGKMTRVGFLGTGPAPTPATPYAPLQAFQDAMFYLNQIQNVCRTKGIDFAVVIIPDEVQVNRSLQTEVRSMFPEELQEKWNITEPIDRFTAAKGTD